MEQNEFKYQFNSDEKAAEIREHDSLVDLNKTMENKDENANKSIVFGVLSLIFMALALWLIISSVYVWGWWSGTEWFCNWIVGGLFVALTLIPSGIMIALQWVKLVPIIKLISWRKEGKINYQWTKKDKMVLIFGVITYVVLQIVRLIGRMIVLFAGE